MPNTKPVVKLGAHERVHQVALVAARLAFLFATQPKVERGRVYLSAKGFVMVREHRDGDRVPPGLLGVYRRDVTLQQLVEDLER